MTGIFIALISGALMSLQGVFNTEVTKQSSVWVSASWVQFSALLTCLAIWAVFDRTSLMTIGKGAGADRTDYSGDKAGDQPL